MSGIAICAVAWGLYRAVAILCGENELMRLRQMTELAVAFAAISAASLTGAFLSFGLALAACRLHPDLRPRPAVSLLLIMLTPAGVACLASLICAPPNFLWVPGNDPWLDSKWHAAAALTVLALPSMGLSWRARLFCFAAGAASTFAGVSSLGGAEPVTWIPLLVSVAAAGWRAGAWRETFVRGLATPVVLLIFAPMLALAARAGPWTQKEGDQLLIVRSPVGGNARGGQALSVQSYGETGLSNTVTFVTSAYQETVRQDAQAGGKAGLRVSILRDEDWIVSVEAGAGVEPFSLTVSQDWKRHAEGELKILAGWSGEFEGVPVYAAAEAGWILRPQEFGDGAIVGATAGVDVTSALQLNFHVSAEINSNDRNSQFAQAGILWRIEDWVGVELGVQAFSGDRQDFETQAIAGVWLRF